MKLQNNFKWELALFALCLFAYFVGYLLPMLFAACENVQMASVSHPDEGRYVKVIREGLNAQTLHIHFVSYGHFFFNLVLIPLLILQLFFTITDVHILLALRLVSWVFGMGSVWLTFVMARRFFGSLVAWSSSILLMIMPLTFLEYSTVSHPDTLQLFFILASLYHICSLSEAFSINSLLWASAMAGLAFSAKYAGILLLPLIALVFGLQLYSTEGLKKSEVIERRVKWMLAILAILCLFGTIVLQNSTIAILFSSDGHIESRWISELIGVARLLFGLCFVLFTMLYCLNWSELLKSKQIKFHFAFYYGIVSMVIFTAAFVLSSSNSLLELQFIQGLLYEGHNTRTGGFFTADWQQIGLQWYVVLTSQYLLGAGLFSLGLAGSFWKLWRE